MADGIVGDSRDDTFGRDFDGGSLDMESVVGGRLILGRGEGEWPGRWGSRRACSQTGDLDEFATGWFGMHLGFRPDGDSNSAGEPGGAGHCS